MSESSNHQHIRKRSWGRFYVAPVLLDHRSYKWLLVTVIVMGAGSFFGGYIAGYEKAEDVFMAELGSMDLVLPEVEISDLALVEAQVPEIEEPGANIDVDSVDEDNIEAATVINNSDKKLAVAAPVKELHLVDPAVEKQPVTEEPVDNVQAEMLASKEQLQPPTLLGVGGPPADADIVVEQTTLAPQAIENQDIIEDATEETARYSIQVGMYSNFNNAANRVEQLLGKELNAYIHDYKNKQDETRYNVRFGYFASFISAKRALENFQTQYAGSGYIARVNR